MWDRIVIYIVKPSQEERECESLQLKPRLARVGLAAVANRVCRFESYPLLALNLLYDPRPLPHLRP